MRTQPQPAEPCRSLPSFRTAGEPIVDCPLNVDHPLRPDKAADAQVWDVAARVPDPEIPVISIADLGILRSAALVDGTARVELTPTYSGCPAMEHITHDVTAALRDAGYHHCQVELVLDPAWSTDWMTDFGKQRLAEYGIAPPNGQARQSTGPIVLDLAPPPAIGCPHCGSDRTRRLTQFGSTSCKALYQCQECLEPFDFFKVH